MRSRLAKRIPDEYMLDNDNDFTGSKGVRVMTFDKFARHVTNSKSVSFSFVKKQAADKLAVWVTGCRTS